MSIYAIADTHLSFGADKPMDSFPGWNDYVYRLEKNWNKLVTPDDTVVIAGDISWAMDFEALLPDFAFLERLNGKKIIGKGNHDFWWNTLSKMNQFLQAHEFHSIEFLYNNAFSVEGVSLCGSRGWMLGVESEQDEKILQREVGRLRMSLQAVPTEEKIVFLHYPPLTTDCVCTPITDLLQEYHVKKCYYGHLHGDAARMAVDGNIDGINYHLISGDRLKFMPLLIKK